VRVARSGSTREVVPETPVAPITDSPWEETESEHSEQTVAYLRLLWERRALLLRAAAWALVVSTIIAFLIPARYESTARLMPPDSQSSSGFAAAAAALAGGSAGGGLSSLAGEYLGLKSTSDVFVGILSSRTVQDKLIEQFGLKKLYWDRRMEDARKDLGERTSVSIDRKSQIVTISVSDRNPQRAAAMAGAYVAELNRLVAELSTSSARRERIFLEGRLQAVGQDLETAEKEFSQFASKNTAIDIKEQGKAMVGAAAELQGEMIAAQSQLEGLRQIYSDSNVRVRTVKARIDELERQLEKIGGKGESSSALPSQGNDSSMYPSIRKLPLLGVEYADLYRRTRVQEAVFETLTKEYEMAKVQEAKEIPTVRVLDAPDIPEKKSSPSRMFIIFFCTSLAVVAVSALVLGTGVWKKTDAADPRKVFALEILSSVSAGLPGFSQNGAKDNSANGWIGKRMSQAKGEREGTE
jgi:capsule polysaccharide export protein KpsE/RkpR